MKNIELLIKNTFNLFPNTIDISDGELRSDNGFYSKNLADCLAYAQSKNGVSGNDVDFMIWTIYRLLHKMSKEKYLKGVYKISLVELDVDGILNEYKRI